MSKVTFKQTILHSYLIICDLVKVAANNLLGVLKDTEVIGNCGLFGQFAAMVCSALLVKLDNWLIQLPM